MNALTPVPSDRRPISTEIKMADGVFMKTMRVARAGTTIPQHAHSFAHVSNVVRGSLLAFAGNQPLGLFRAPAAVVIKALIKHTFTTLEDDTIVLCVHDIGAAEAVEIAEEHQIAITPGLAPADQE